MDLHVTIPTAHGGLTLKNPIMPAASTFGNIIEYAKVFDLNKLGALMGNSMYLTDGTPTGNQKFHRAEDGFMSAFGRNAISIRRFVEEILPELPWETTPVILDLKEAELLLPVKDKRVRKAVTFKDGTPVEHERTEEGLLLRLGQIPTDIDHVVEIIWKPSRQTGARGTKTHK